MNGRPQPRAWAVVSSEIIDPYSSAPATAQPGRHPANITTASATQPRPLAMSGDQVGVNDSTM